jgi:4-hydroxybenzoate polyprenyltransferase
MTPREMLGVIAASCVLFILTTAGFLLHHNPWPLVFSVPTLAVVLLYPLFKRFTRLCHYYLGLCLALAPICAWVAIAGTLAFTPLLLGAAVLLWTGGFDILYACLDYDNDVRNGIFSVPAKLGIRKALWTARLTHVASAILIFTPAFIEPRLGAIYASGAILACLLLIGEHSLVSERDLSKMNTAFFTFNGIISATLCAMGILDLYR